MSKTVHVLCVDDDDGFIQYLLASARAFDVIVETTGTFTEALSLLQQKRYDAYIVDLKMPDGSGFDLVKKIREISKEAPIAVVSGAFRDEESFRKLKDEERIDYALDKPVYPKQIEHLLSQFCAQKSASPESEDKFAQLKKKYESTISDKIETLTKDVRKAEKNPDQEALEELKNTVHKIGGSAGSYGYPEVSRLCKTLENEIRHYLDTNTLPEANWPSLLEHFLHDVKYHFQISETRPEKSPFFHNAVKGKRDGSSGK